MVAEWVSVLASTLSLLIHPNLVLRGHLSAENQRKHLSYKIHTIILRVKFLTLCQQKHLFGATPLDMEKVYHSETRECHKDIFPSVRKRETQNQQNFSVTKKYNNIRELQNCWWTSLCGTWEGRQGEWGVKFCLTLVFFEWCLSEEGWVALMKTVRSLIKSHQSKHSISFPFEFLPESRTVHATSFIPFIFHF